MLHMAPPEGEALTTFQEHFRMGIARNLATHPNGFRGMPRPLFGQEASETTNPVALALHAMDAVMAEPVPGSVVPVLGPINHNREGSGRITGQFLQAVGLEGSIDAIVPFNVERLDKWRERKSRLIKLYFGTIALVQNVVIDEGAPLESDYQLRVAPKRRSQ